MFTVVVKSIVSLIKIFSSTKWYEKQLFVKQVCDERQPIYHKTE